MADDNTLRSYRSNDPYRRSPSEGSDTVPGADPLAELARLIGQNDPFADPVRDNFDAVPRVQSAPAGDWRQHIERPDYSAMRDEPPLAADPHYQNDPHGHYQHDQQYAAPAYDDRAYAAGGPYEAAGEPHRDVYDDNHAGISAPAAGEEYYDDPPHRHVREGRKGGWLMTGAMLAGCALLGIAGAYGYRTYAAPTAGGKQAAPVIVADNAPNKIVPAANEAKPPRTQERVPTQGGEERLVSREEQPVALPPAGGGSPPRVVFPPLVQNPQPAAPPPASTGSAGRAAAAPAPAPAAAPSSTEPKRVRTVTIRADRNDPSGRPVNTTTQSTPPPRANTRQVPTREAPSRHEPLSLDPGAQAQAQVPTQAPVRSQQQRVALTPPAPRDTAPPPAGRPQAWEPAPRETGSPQREAPNNGSRLAAVPPNAGNGGGYVVQVSSQRSEADAQASYRGLQAKYPQLKSRQATIRRADLGSKGVYYRAMVGPFGSSGEAGQFCNSLKAAGGQCIILRN